MLCSRLAASQQERLTKQQAEGDICIGSDCHLSNGCIEPHPVASDGPVSAKLEQCINNARYTR